MSETETDSRFEPDPSFAFLIYKSLILPLERVNRERAKIRKFGIAVTFADETP